MYKIVNNISVTGELEIVDNLLNPIDKHLCSGLWCMGQENWDTLDLT